MNSKETIEQICYAIMGLGLWIIVVGYIFSSEWSPEKFDQPTTYYGFVIIGYAFAYGVYKRIGRKEV